MQERTTNPTKEGSESRGMQYYCTLRFFEYVRPTPFDNAPENPVSTILLPLPIQLIDSTSAAFAQQDLGAVGDIMNGAVVGGTAAALLRGGVNALGDIASILTKASPGGRFANLGRLSNPNDVLGQAAEVGSNFAKRNLINADTITTAIEQTLGVAPNPNPTVKFTGPVLRDASYTWYFNPKNAKESASIRTIIQRIKSLSLPSYTMGSSAILNYPHLAQINFYPWDQSLTGEGSTPNRWGWKPNSIIKLKRCFITSVNVNYNPANVPAFYKDDNPVVYELSIQLKEVEYMTSNSWEDDENSLTDRVGASLKPVEATTDFFSDLFKDVTGQPRNTELIRAIL
jgi:hypothetical protein